MTRGNVRKRTPKILMRLLPDGVHRVWVTKWALTPTGVIVTDGTYFYGCGEHYLADAISFKMGTDVYMSTQHAHGKDWHLTYDAAYERVEEMQKRKLASIEKAKKRVENFDYANIPR